ncbi:MAG: preprotein translocase subunit SecE [bacterium]|nr:preprotein translocase subunit SecE [bacterium]
MNILAKSSKYVADSFHEMKKVTWPTKKETQQYTILVIAISLIVALYLGGLDYIFNFGLNFFIN